MIFQSEYNNEYADIHKYSHLIAGGLIGIQEIPLFYRKLLLFLILIYQFGQLLCNVRFFINKLKYCNGNSLSHTLNKLFDYLLGFIIVKLYYLISH